VILKAFKVDCHLPKAPRIIEVLWHSPVFNWIKCNTDGTALGAPSLSACAAISRNNLGQCIGCFADNTGNSNAFFVEIMGIILAIEHASEKGWNNLRIESDSVLATSHGS